MQKITVSVKFAKFRLEFSQNNLSEQDKVNYAVSERDDRVTGATALMRMAGYNRLYWAATVLC